MKKQFPLFFILLFLINCSSKDKKQTISSHAIQGILADAKDEKNTNISNMVIRNNNIYITNTIFKGRAVKYATKYKFVEVNNPCNGCNDGLFYRP